MASVMAVSVATAASSITAQRELGDTEITMAAEWYYAKGGRSVFTRLK